MKIALSNIAWDPADDEAVAALMRRHGASGIEIAPTKIWPRPLEASPDSIEACRQAWADRGFAVAALQSILFGRPDLTLFGSAESRLAMAEYLEGILTLAARLGAGAVVFGSPKNRIAGALSKRQADDIALPFFARMAEAAHSRGVAFCLEPNPAVYACDYVRTVAEALAVIRQVDHPGLRLNLDTGIMHLNGEPVEATVAEALPATGHIHLSEPQLGVVGAGGVDHAAIAASLSARHYQGWVSIEMRSGWNTPDTISVDSALAAAARHYAGAQP